MLLLYYNEFAGKRYTAVMKY